MTDERKDLDVAIDTAASEVPPSDEAIKSDGLGDSAGSAEAPGAVDADADTGAKGDLGPAEVAPVDGHGLQADAAESADKETELNSDEGRDKAADLPADADGAGDDAGLPEAGPADAADGASLRESDTDSVGGGSDLLPGSAVAGDDAKDVEPADTVPPTTDEAAPIDQPPLQELKPVSEVPADSDAPDESPAKADDAADAAPKAPSAPTLGDVRGEVAQLDELPRAAIVSLRDAGISLFRFLAELESADDGLQGEAKARLWAVRGQTVQLLAAIERVFVRQG